jgi:hypothetical protein
VIKWKSVLWENANDRFSKPARRGSLAANDNFGLKQRRSIKITSKADSHFVVEREALMIDISKLALFDSLIREHVLQHMSTAISTTLDRQTLELIKKSRVY